MRAYLRCQGSDYQCEPRPPHPGHTWHLGPSLVPVTLHPGFSALGTRYELWRWN